MRHKLFLFVMMICVALLRPCMNSRVTARGSIVPLQRIIMIYHWYKVRFHDNEEHWRQRMKHATACWYTFVFVLWDKWGISGEFHSVTYDFSFFASVACLGGVVVFLVLATIIVMFTQVFTKLFFIGPVVERSCVNSTFTGGNCFTNLDLFCPTWSHYQSLSIEVFVMGFVAEMVALNYLGMISANVIALSRPPWSSCSMHAYLICFCFKSWRRLP